MSRWAPIAAGVALGVTYTLSPLTVLCTAALILIVRWAGKDLAERERDWFFIVFVSAIVLRLAVIGALILSADDSRPYAAFFGDEWIFKSRPIWLRNVGLGIPVSTADFIYAFDETGMSGHLYALAFLQALVGDAPYGVHVFNVTLYIGALAVLYRLVRRSFGVPVALGGTVVLLFMPSLFAWSVSALKEPSYIAAAVLELLLVLWVVRAPTIAWRVAAAAGLVVIAVAMEELRQATLMVVALGAVVGWTGGWILQSRRRIIVTAAVVPIALLIAIQQTPVQARLRAFAHESIRYHVGHVVTPGVSYKLVDPRYYRRWEELANIPPREATRYFIRAVAAFVIEPSPDNVQSTLLWAYLPEHLVWLALFALIPFGVATAIRRDPILASVLLAHAAALGMKVALTSGNIGTLVRHRGLTLPYLVWFSMLGMAAIITWAARPTSAKEPVR